MMSSPTAGAHLRTSRPSRSPARRGSAVLAGVLLLALLTGVAIEAMAAQHTLGWVIAGNELGFVVERAARADGVFGPIDIVGPGVTSYTDTTAADGTTYCYRLWAFDATGISEPSNIACSPALDVSLAMNQPSFASGDDVAVSAHLQSISDFSNPVDGYFYVEDPAGSMFVLRSYTNFDLPGGAFGGIGVAGTLPNFSAGTYRVFFALVRAGGDPQNAADRLSPFATVSFDVR